MFPNATYWAHFYYSKLINRLPASKNLALIFIYFYFFINMYVQASLCTS